MMGVLAPSRPHAPAATKTDERRWGRFYPSPAVSADAREEMVRTMRVSRPSCRGCGRLLIRVREEERDGTRGDARGDRIGATGEHDRHARAEHHAGGLRVGEEVWFSMKRFESILVVLNQVSGRGIAGVQCGAIGRHYARIPPWRAFIRAALLSIGVGPFGCMATLQAPLRGACVAAFHDQCIKTYEPGASMSGA